MAKICPLIMMSAMTTIDYGAFASPRNRHRDNFSSAADCFEDFCQMWNPETKDCGLKQTPVVPVLTEIKSTLEGISQDVNVIRSNVE